MTEPSKLTSQRRSDIQGLRAIAVLIVVAFHMGLPMPGGFVGVDVFFVVSGYVITAMLHREWLASHRIRFGHFYLRRFKRLMPALALVVSAILVVSGLILPPLAPQMIVAETGVGAILVMANYVIAVSTGHYFDPAAETNPLLNMWSLSVEEQFYLVFPLVLFAGWKLARRFRNRGSIPIILVVTVALASFTLATWGSSSGGSLTESQNVLTGFYSSLTRAWEFAIGALLAMLVAGIGGVRRPMVSLALGGLGAALLAYSVFTISGETPFPGPWTLLPVLSTALLLLAGTDPENPVSRILSNSWLVKVGDWSYSIYLWHWPLIAFAVYIFPQTAPAAIVAGLLSFLPALVSYYWVEQPLRKLNPASRHQWDILILAVVLPPLALGAGLMWAQQNGWAASYWVAHEGDIGHRDFHSFIRDHNYPCTPTEIREHALEWEGIPRCQQSKADPRVTVAIVGDSHAEHLFLGLSEALPNQNVAYYISAGLPGLGDADSIRIVDHVAASPTIKSVVISAFWHARRLPTVDLVKSLERLTDAGKQVFVTDDIPAFPFDAAGCKYLKGAIIPWSDCSQSIERHQRAYSAYATQLQEIVEGVPGAHFVKIAQFLCTEATCDMTLDDDRLLYRDTNHLNINGSRYIGRRMLGENPLLRKALEATGHKSVR